MSARCACWRSSMANHHTSSPNPSSSTIFCIAKTSSTSRQPPCASATAASASSTYTFWNAIGSSSTSFELNPNTGSQLSSVCKKGVACSAWPHPCTTVCTLPPSIAWDSDCTKDSFSKFLTSTANDSWSTFIGARGPRTATSPSLQILSPSCDATGQHTPIPPGFFPPLDVSKST